MIYEIYMIIERIGVFATTAPLVLFLQIYRIETVARVYGNSSHCITPKEWLGKMIVCIL